VSERNVVEKVPSELSLSRTSPPVGSVLPMTAGSAAQVLLAHADRDDAERLLAEAAFPATALAQVRRRGWAASVAERESGVASVSAPDAGSTAKVGPDLDKVVADAAKYAKGKNAAAYIKESIENPNAFVVPGFPKGTMPQTFGQQLSPTQISALVKFLIASGGGGGGKKK